MQQITPQKKQMLGKWFFNSYNKFEGKTLSLQKRC